MAHRTIIQGGLAYIEKEQKTNNEKPTGALNTEVVAAKGNEDQGL